MYRCALILRGGKCVIHSYFGARRMMGSKFSDRMLSFFKAIIRFCVIFPMGKVIFCISL